MRSNLAHPKNTLETENKELSGEGDTDASQAIISLIISFYARPYRRVWLPVSANWIRSVRDDTIQKIVTVLRFLCEFFK